MQCFGKNPPKNVCFVRLRLLQEQVELLVHVAARGVRPREQVQVHVRVLRVREGLLDLVGGDVEAQRDVQDLRSRTVFI